MKKTNVILVIIIVVLLLAFVGEIGFIVYKLQLPGHKSPPIDKKTQNQDKNPNITSNNDNLKLVGFKKFESEQDFKNYLATAEKEDFGYSNGFSSRSMGTVDIGLDAVSMETGLGEVGSSASFGEAPTGLAMAPKAMNESVDRYSETNVQVLGVDEPDYVKTNGKELFYSSNSFNFAEPAPTPMNPNLKVQPEMMPRYYNHGGTVLLKAFPPKEMKLDSRIDQKYGELLINKDFMLIFSYNKVYGYNIADVTKPNKKWEMTLENNSSISGVRMYSDKIYMVVETYVNNSKPCPYQPLSIDNEKMEVACTNIYHPELPSTSDSTYTVFKLNPETGEIGDKVAFVGANGRTVLYMSNSALYFAYYFPGNPVELLFNFIDENKDFLPAEIADKIQKLKSYDISVKAKMTEIEDILDKYHATLSDDERLRIDNEMENRMKTYVKNHRREMEVTNIIKVKLDDLQIDKIGKVAGVLLNQFSIDEYNNNLRVATTVGGRGSYFGSDDSVNDVYVLSSNMDTLGSVQDLGETERIYSVRFINDMGYVVTFRETDPLYIIDLKDPNNPKKTGELKIPGYSAYLHPISDTKILGIGKEGANVKISLFDVSDSTNPKEITTYTTKEYGSDILYNHHAFLLDKAHQIFFIPGYSGGHVFSYANDKIEMKKAVSGYSVNRAIYINDYLYIIGNEEITIFDEKTWEQVNKFKIE